MYKLLVSLFLVTLLVACSSGGTPAANPFAPQPSDDTAMMRGPAEIVSANLVADPAAAGKVSLALSYRLPTPCYQLRVVVHDPDSQSQILVDVYGVAPKDKPCSLMALSTPLEASLALGSFPAGHYTVLVNGQKAGELDE